MFKFIKELIGAFKEGIAEGIAESNEELAKETYADNLKKEIEQQEIPNIPRTESFGVALGAPFRSVFFSDWFSLFGVKEKEESYPIHLYKFVTYTSEAETKKTFTDLLRRDFSIVDIESCIFILSTFFSIAKISTSGTELVDLEDVEDKKWDISKDGVNALVVSVSSHIVSASTEVGYLEKEDALNILEKLNQYAHNHFNSWTEYSKAFLIGEKNVGLNNRLGRSVLVKQVKLLNEKIGSPWNNISWSE